MRSRCVRAIRWCRATVGHPRRGPVPPRATPCCRRRRNLSCPADSVGSARIHQREVLEIGSSDNANLTIDHTGGDQVALDSHPFFDLGRTRIGQVDEGDREVLDEGSRGGRIPFDRIRCNRFTAEDDNVVSLDQDRARGRIGEVVTSREACLEFNRGEDRCGGGVDDAQRVPIEVDHERPARLDTIRFV